MTRNQIITDLFLSKDFNTCIRKMEPKSLQDELKAEVALILCEYPDDKIIGLHQRKELRFFTVRIILNLIRSNTSSFYKKFRVTNVELSEIIEPIIEEYNAQKDTALEEIENLYWYDREILKLYAKHGTYRKIEEVTGIPFESVYKTCNKSFKIIRERLSA